MPTPAVLQMVGDLFKSHSIKVHFDVGPPNQYKALVGAYNSTVADEYLIGLLNPNLARGGENPLETKCKPDISHNPPRWQCPFPDFPGTVDWKAGYQAVRDGLVAADGSELGGKAADKQAFCPSSPGSCRIRFDRERLQFFHDVLFAHATGIAKSPFPCLDANGIATTFNGDGVCKAPSKDNPDFHVPLSVSGKGDLPGGDSLVSLGLWDKTAFVGSTFFQASTLTHELGHTFSLYHGGWPDTYTPVQVNDPIAGKLVTRTQVVQEPNCKPNYPSVTSYSFQLQGLRAADINGGSNALPHLAYSDQQEANLADQSLADGSLPSSLNFFPAWFVPANSPLGLLNGVTPAKKYCSGSPWPGGVAMGRIDFDPSTMTYIDWNGDKSSDSGGFDVNFDGTLSTGTSALRGYNDWANIHLNQV